MNKLSDYKIVYEEASLKVSDLTRQMALAGIAIIWIFRQTDQQNQLICKELIPPLLLFVTTLTFDILQYIYKTIAWYIFFRNREKKVKKKNPDPLTQAKPIMNRPAWICFWIKVISLITGYILIFVYLFDKLIKAH
ncbi:MAG: hypothetical protein V1903_14010 [Bacteroidota bacterium]